MERILPLLKHLSNGITLWRQGLPVQGNAILDQQSLIGWDGILEGCLGNHWQHAQASAFIKNEAKCNGITWAPLIVRRLWKIAWQIWEFRNKKEHSDDTQREEQRLNEATDKDQGPNGHLELDQMMEERKVEEVHRAIKLRNVRARKKWMAKQQEGSREMQGMQLYMARFLQSRNNQNTNEG
jgi:hypothetical protein